MVHLFIYHCQVETQSYCLQKACKHSAYLSNHIKNSNSTTKLHVIIMSQTCAPLQTAN